MTVGDLRFLSENVSYEKQQECIWFRGGDLTGF